MKVIWGRERDENGNPTPEAVRRALEHKKPLPWPVLVVAVWILSGFASFAFKPLIGTDGALSVCGGVMAFAFVWAGNRSVRQVTARLFRWLVP